MITKIPLSSLPLFLSAIGGIIFSQMLSFGWPSKVDPALSSHITAICLALAGLGLLFLGNFVRQMLIKMSSLEKELAQLKAGNNRP
jgi:hypothetical protein